MPEPLRLTYYGGERVIVKRDAMLIRIQTDEGLIGYAPGVGSEEAKAAIDEAIGPFLTGRTLADPDALRVQFQQGAGAEPHLSQVYGSVEIGLYDLVGKARRVPVSELIGGRVRDSIRLYGSAGMYMEPEQYAAEAAAIQALGFAAYKMRASGGPDQDVDAVRRVREAVGPDFDIMVDAHTWWRMGERSYSAETVAKVAERLNSYRIAWLEEPLPPDDHEAYLRLKQLDLAPLATGEHEPNELRYLDLVESQCVDYIQMDVACQGGYTTARRLFPDIARAGLHFAFHSWGTALELIAAAQLGLCWPESVVRWLEYPCYATPTRAGMYPFPLAAEILARPLQIDHGELIVPRGPGLGVEIDESVIWRYPWIPGPWSCFHVTAPAGTWALWGDSSVKWSVERSEARQAGSVRRAEQ